MKTTLGKVGWIVLTVINGLMLLNHVIGIAVIAGSSDERQMFVGYAATTALGLLVMLFAYRSLARWAWWASWIPIVAIFVVLFIGGIGPIGIWYGTTAAVMALAQAATAREFFGKPA